VSHQPETHEDRPHPHEHRDDNPQLADIVERNIRTLAVLKRQRSRRRTAQDRIADAITAFSGSMLFAYIHAVLFGGWILVNTGRFGMRAFDPYPYQLLTMAVSLEAIFLSTFVLVSQNRMAKEADRRADLDLQIDLLAEHETTRVLQMLDAIQDRLGIANEEDRELRELEQQCTPEIVLEHLERTEAEIRP
jgi:uncharacterized membrane protein